MCVTHTALALLITGCAQQTFTVQNKPAAVAPKETITHHCCFWNWAEETVDAAKICMEMLLNRNPANIRKWIARFYYFSIYTPLEARVCIAHNNCMSCPSIWATLSALLINILSGFLPLMCSIQISLSLWVK